MKQKAAWPVRCALTWLILVCCTVLQTEVIAESMMRKEDPSNSAAAPAAVTSIANLQDVRRHPQEPAGSELNQKKDLSSSKIKEEFYSKDGSEALMKNNEDEASKMHVTHISNVIIMPKKGIIKQIQIPTKVVPPPAPLTNHGSGGVAEVISGSTSEEPHIIPYAGQHLSDTDSPDEDTEPEAQPNRNTPRPTSMPTADRLRQEQAAARAAGGQAPKLARPFTPPRPRHLQQLANPDSLARVGSSSQIHRSDEGFQGMAQAAKELILEEELERAEKQHQDAVAAGVIDPPHAEEPEEDGDKYDTNEDEDEEDRMRFYNGRRLSTAPPTLQRPYWSRAPASMPEH